MRVTEAGLVVLPEMGVYFFIFFKLHLLFVTFNGLFPCHVKSPSVTDCNGRNFYEHLCAFNLFKK